ncbi:MULTISPECIES: tyrosine-type recombinase/integrase [unclassified Acinetobacter]|uniref:tyrosine-type recombinase/integrase n=1 Tax=unclassified Acinetobacter TaxID=196816 RepID=UPI0035B9600A
MARSNQLNKLTDIQVKKLKDPKKYSDGGGMYLHITAQGGKYWRMDYYRPISKKRNTLPFGTYPEISLAQARLQRDEARALLAQGIDPSEHKKALQDQADQENKNTFAKFAELWLHNRELEKKVDSETVRKLDKDILPFIGDIPISKLTLEQLQSVVSQLIDRNALESARRTKSIIKMILDLAERKQVIDRNLAKLIVTPTPKKGNHTAITNEAQLAELLQALWLYRANYPRAREIVELCLKLSVYIRTYAKP